MKKYKVRVEAVGKTIFFKNKKVRTPFTTELADSELNLFKFAMAADGISNYTIEEIKKDDSEKAWEEMVTIPEDKDVVIEDLYIEEEREPSTILEKLLKDEKNGE